MRVGTGPRIERGWFRQRKAIPVFMKHLENEVGFVGPVCLVRPLYFADMTTDAPAVQQRDAKLKRILPPDHRGYRDIGAFLIIEYKGPMKK